MNRKKFEVIKGGQSKDYQLAFRFIEAQATNSRLMGVIGLRIKWETEEGETFYQFFHLDAEEFGLDDYMSILDASSESIEMTTARVMGGLGGKLVSLNKKEAVYLIQHFADKNRVQKEELPEPIDEYVFILEKPQALSEEELQLLWEKICEPIESPLQLIHYFVMRAVGTDYEAVKYLGGKELIHYRPVKSPSTLLKNIIEEVEEGEKRSYVVESLVDDGNNYKMIFSEIQVEKVTESWKLTKAEVKSQMHITPTEAAFGLGKEEYITVFHIRNFRELIRRLDKEKPHALKNGYELGLLYTEFFPTNAHVKKQTYYLNDDVYGVYYVTEASQLLVAAYKKECIEELEMYFQGPMFEGFVELEERLHLDRSLLYEFVHSEYDNFYDFLEVEL